MTTEEYLGDEEAIVDVTRDHTTQQEANRDFWLKEVVKGEGYSEAHSQKATEGHNDIKEVWSELLNGKKEGTNG